MEQNLQNSLQEAFEQLLNSPVLIRKQRRNKAFKKKILFISLIDQYEKALNKSTRLQSEFGLDLFEYEEPFYGVIDKLMLLTWGTSVGGFLLPLDHFIKTGNFNVSDDQANLILAGIAFIIFFENKRGVSTILKKIKEEGLEDTFKIILNKALDLKGAFVDFLSSANIKVGTLMDTISYSFLIPIITDIQSVITRTSNLKEASIIIAERLVASGVVILSAEMLSKIIKKIITKIK
jgi:hypothetical protein